MRDAAYSAINLFVFFRGGGSEWIYGGRIEGGKSFLYNIYWKSKVNTGT